ncbi:MAG: OsmC family protein [Gemmatimonadaceae bacterium]|nr:OsmC family protein [Gemmatimonadaceae bacterium]NUO94547.1 OsmC family protein [Gemmatimonadaceae bacterium]NUP55495.1 OsmC family protein [Gemmatimonadaceae bacterium]NUP72652.1 OsmC family protein [Gemmatimonadaceae bacterium]NUR33730.1 OsmC family protein [Gemmatimonadaceae bacterium]
MKITLLGDDAIRLEPVPGALTIEAPSADASYSPFHMLGSSLASCTFSVLSSWATHARIPIDDLTIDVRWRFADDPHRVGDIDVSFKWPSLPANRQTAAKRVAEMCTVHATLMHPPRITIGAIGDATMRPGAADATAGIAHPAGAPL